MDFTEYLENNCTVSSAAGGAELVVHEDCPFGGCAGGKIYVNAKKQIGICFRCNETFAGPKFIAAFEGIPYGKAQAILNDDLSRYERLVDDVPGVDEPWYPQVENMPEKGYKYLADRGFDKAFVDSMGLRFCSVNTQAPDGKIWYTSNRIIFYIRDRFGEVISWQGRDITGKSKIKYLFQPGFKGSESLYNIERMSVDTKSLILVEGVMDAWGWMRAGYRDVVATWGKKISKQQLETIYSLDPETVYIAWDGDAYFNRAEFAREYGHLFDVKIIDMAGEDADELDAEALRGKYHKASSYMWADVIMGGLKGC